MDGTKPKILVVDDSVTQRQRMHDTLVAGGYDVVLANDGLLGLQAAVKERPDVIFSDIQMPNLDGISMCKAVKEHGATRSIPVIFVSTLDSMDDLVSGLEAGASDYLSKQSDGPEQILAMAKVHADYSRQLRARLGTTPDSEEVSLDAEEFSPVTELPARFFDGLSFGLVVTNLRRRPIYVNREARRILGYPQDQSVFRLDTSTFDLLVSEVARGFSGSDGTFFYYVNVGPLCLEIHLEQVQNARSEICGLMIMLREVSL